MDYTKACADYRGLLVEHSTFSSMTFEALLEAKALPLETTSALRRRYIVD